MAGITSENLALTIVKLVADEALPVLEPNLRMAALVNRDYEAVLANRGDTVQIPVAPTLVANDMSETGNVTLQAANFGNISVSLTQHKEASFVVNDVAKALSNIDVLRSLMQPAMLALASKVETDLLSTSALFTFNTPLGTAGTDPTEALVDTIETSFFDASVPDTEERICACSSGFYSKLRQVERFSEERMIGSGDAILSGNVGRLKNVSFFRSQFIKAVGSSPATTTNLAFTRNGIALVVRKLPLAMPGQGVVQAYADYKNLSLRVSMSYNPNSLAQQFTVDILYGVATLRQQCGVQVLS